MTTRLLFDGQLMETYASFKLASDAVYAFVREGEYQEVQGGAIEFKTAKAHTRFLPQYKQNWRNLFTIESSDLQHRVEDAANIAVVESRTTVDWRELLKKYAMFVRDWQCCTGYPVHYPTTSHDHPDLSDEERAALMLVIDEATREQDAQYYNAQKR